MHSLTLQHVLVCIAFGNGKPVVAAAFLLKDWVSYHERLHFHMIVSAIENFLWITCPTRVNFETQHVRKINLETHSGE